MKPILFLFTGMFFATLAGAEISIVRDTPEYYNFTVESPDRPVRLTLTLKNFPLEAGKNYWVTSSYQYAECVAAAKNGELDIAFPPVLRTAVTVAPFSGNLLPGGSFEDASAWLLEQKSGIMPVNGDRGTDGHYGRLLGKNRCVRYRRNKDRWPEASDEKGFEPRCPAGGIPAEDCIAAGYGIPSERILYTAQRRFRDNAVSVDGNYRSGGQDTGRAGPQHQSGDY